MKEADQALTRPVSSEQALFMAALNEQCANAWKASSDAHKFRMDTGAVIRTLVSERDALAGRVRELEAAIHGVLHWDEKRNFPIPYKVRDPLRAALTANTSGAEK